MPRYLTFVAIAIVLIAACSKNDPKWGPRLDPKASKISKIEPKNIDWKKEVIYFLLVDRFADGNPSNNAIPGKPNSHKKYVHGISNSEDLKTYQGGDMAGTIKKLDYLKNLGISAIWLSPVFDNINAEFIGGWWPYHGYHPYDFYSVEDRFGDLSTLKKLVDEAHKRDLKVILDMVYNQTSPDHLWVVDPKNWNEKGFLKWFHPHSGKDSSTSIQNWMDQEELENKELFGLPDLNQDNPNVYAYLLDVSKYWIENTGADGFRLDAVKHISKGFWKKINADLHATFGKDFLMLGEVFEGNPNYVAGYQDLGFNALFDIPLYYTLRSVFAEGNSMTILSDRLIDDMKIYSPNMIWSTLLDNHDVIRFSHWAGSNVSQKIKLAMTLLTTTNGMPMVYYGTEVALEGGADKNEKGESTDYLNRLNFPWDRVEKESQAGGIIDHLKKILALRKISPALYDGKMLELYKDPCTYIYVKVAKEDYAVVALNNCEALQTVSVPVRYDMLKDGDTIKDIFGKDSIMVSGGNFTVTLPSFGSAVYYSKNTAGVSLPDNYDIAVSPVYKSTGDFMQIKFRFKPERGDITKVAVAGDFNNWDPKKDEMKPAKEKGVWEIEIPLRKGKHRYKLVMNGDEWIVDPNSKDYEIDAFGGRNSVVEVR